MSSIPRIVITSGEPAGIGAEILIKAAQQHFDTELIAVADPNLLLMTAKRLNLTLNIEEIEASTTPDKHVPQTMKVIPVSLTNQPTLGKLNPQNASYVITCLEKAADLCLQGKANALVTGPVHKGILNDAGFSFKGHTEFLANYCKINAVIMLFVTKKIKVALVTTHIPLKDVPKIITKDKLTSILQLLHTELHRFFKINNPTILVCGLNPHAGEKGYLGREEIEIIEPVINQLKLEGLNIEGPLPADTIFTEKHLAKADVILGMYHDQVLPVIKYLGFGQAINVTLGLPIIRTSVDHGTALDIAEKGIADPGSLISAIQLAQNLSLQEFPLKSAGTPSLFL